MKLYSTLSSELIKHSIDLTNFYRKCNLPFLIDSYNCTSRLMNVQICSLKCHSTQLESVWYYRMLKASVNCNMLSVVLSHYHCQCHICHSNTLNVSATEISPGKIISKRRRRGNKNTKTKCYNTLNRNEL